MDRVKRGVIQPGGWHYKQPLTNGDYQQLPPSEGDLGVYEELLDYVTTWRLENNYPVGDVRSDVDNYICSNFPRQCNDISISAVDRIDSFLKTVPGTRFVDRIIDWASNLAYRQVQVVHQGTADQRARYCQQCKFNTAWENSCAQCVTKANQLLGLIRKGKDSGAWRKLKACSFYEHDNRTAVWLKRSELTLKDKTPPPECWIGKEGMEE